jgi:hypothetical protein
MLPVNAVGERLEGKPHEPFDGGGGGNALVKASGAPPLYPTLHARFDRGPLVDHATVS